MRSSTHLFLSWCLLVWSSIILSTLRVEGFPTITTRAWNNTSPTNALNKVCKWVHFGPVEWEPLVVFIDVRFTNVLIRNINIYTWQLKSWIKTHLCKLPKLIDVVFQQGQCLWCMDMKPCKGENTSKGPEGWDYQAVCIVFLIADSKHQWG